MAGFSRTASRSAHGPQAGAFAKDWLTTHARARMQQRGISASALDVLLDFGRVTRAGRGRELIFFDRKARERLADAKALAAGEADRVCNSYAIVASDGKVVTVGHRFRRVPRGR